MRRFLIILFVLLLIGVGVWYFFFRKTADGTPVASGNVFQTFFSKNNTPVTPEGTTVAGAPGTEPTVVTPVLPVASRFSTVADFPVAGYVVFDRTKTITIPPPAETPNAKPTTQTLVEHYIRFVSRRNGYVYEIKDGGQVTQISNIYIPNVYEATFTADGTVALVRFLRDDNRTIATYAIPVPEANLDGSRSQLEGTYFADGIDSLALSPDQKTVLSVLKTGNGSQFITSTLINATRKELFSHAFESWLPQWEGKTVYLQTKASASAPGYLYRLDSAAKRLTKILGDIAGLTASVSPKETYALYSASTNTGFTSSILTLKTGAVRNLSISVLPEKCGWISNENLVCAGATYLESASYPDAWYLGTTRLHDALYRIYTSTGGYDTLDEGSEWSYDATHLSVDEGQSRLYFIDKTTGLLWRYQYR